MHKLLSGCVALAIAIGVGSAANAQTITFDDLSDSFPVSNGYAGLNWDNFQVLDGTQAGLEATGYATGVVSSPLVIFNRNGDPATISSTAASGFMLGSADFTAAWADQAVYVNGLTVGGGILSDTFWTTTSGPVLHIFDWNNVATVTFSTSYAQLVMDNLTINAGAAVPEPASWALMIGGLGLTGIAARRRRDIVRKCISVDLTI